MTYDYRGAVQQFHEAMGVECAPTRTVADEAIRVLRVKLLVEEVLEFAKAAGVRIAMNAVTVRMERLWIGPTYDSDPDEVQMAHELADIHYVTFGADLAFGFPSERVFTEIHSANMRKLGPDGKPVRRADGKVVKPVGWRPADVARVLDVERSPYR